MNIAIRKFLLPIRELTLPPKKRTSLLLVKNQFKENAMSETKRRAKDTQDSNGRQFGWSKADRGPL